MLKSTHKVSEPEMKLLKAIDTLGFGEISDVHVEDAPKTIETNLGDKQVALLKIIRSGHPDFNKLIIHNSLPMQVEFILQLQGYRCMRKLRV